MFAIPLDRSAAQVDFSQPYFVGGLALLLKGDSKLVKLEDLDGKKVAAVDQTANDPAPEWNRAIARRGLHATLQRYPTFALAAQAVESGRADALLSHDANIRAWVEAKPSFKMMAGLITREEIGVAVKRGNADLLAVVNAVVEELRKSGQLEAWAKKWKLPYLL